MNTRKNPNGEALRQPHQDKRLEFLKLPQVVGIKCAALPTTFSLQWDEDTRKPKILYMGTLLSSLPIQKYCLSCDIPLKRSNKSRICVNCYHRMRQIEYQIRCDNCGDIYTMSAPQFQKKSANAQSSKFYCSLECAGKGAVKPRFCRDCGEQILSEKSVNHRILCDSCVTKNKRSQKKLFPRLCELCGKEFSPHSQIARYCSRTCSNKAHSQRMSGTGNSHYKHGESYSKEFLVLRDEAIERDGHACAVCQKKEAFKSTKRYEKQSNLTVHHINHDFQDDRLENLITLCRSCHTTHHKTVASGKPTPFPLLSF